MSDWVFAIAEMKQREHLINITVRNWCDRGWVKLTSFFIKISSKFAVMCLISGLKIGLRLADKS